MEDAHREQPSIPKKNASVLGTVRVVCRPAPDADDRLRHLFTLLVKHATRDGEAASEDGSPAEARRAGDHPEMED